MSKPQGNEPIADMSPETMAIVGNVVEMEIDREYGHAVSNDEIRGLRILAAAGVEMDLAGAWLRLNGNGYGLAEYARQWMRKLIADGLSARLCECSQLFPEHPHGHSGGCPRHTEADVPVLDGKRLCGNCHVAVYNAAHRVR